MNFRNIRVIFKKELVDITRDRRTMIFMIILPMLAIPVLMFLMSKLVSSGVQRLQEESSIVAVIGGDESPSLVTLLGGLENALNDPMFFTRLNDPTLARGLNYMMRGDEMADAALAASTLQASVSEEGLGSARFIEVQAFTPSGDEGRTLFANGQPAFLRDAKRLRLVATAYQMRADAAAESEEETSAEVGGLDPPTADGSFDVAVLSDRARIAAMSDSERRVLESDVDGFETLRRDLASGLETRKFHSLLVLHEGFGQALHSDATARYSVFYDESVEKSDVARRKLSGFLDRLSNGLVRARVDGHGLDLSLLDPMVAESINIGRSRNILSYMLPYMVLLMCLVGAIYPASDLGAGEKERGTLETLLVTPARRSELVIGKFLVITLAAMVAALLNILGLTGSFVFGLAGEELGAGLVFDPMAVVVSVVLMVPVAAFFAGILLALSIFAKSYKEAQSYASALNMVVIMPALVSFIPGIELTIPLSFVPLVNVTLALKEAWAGIFQWDCIAVILGSSFLYAGLALSFCVYWFQREEVLFRT